jgi:hypothetical protein
MTRRPFVAPRPLFFLTAATVAMVAVACGDLTGIPASLPTLSDTGTVYAINGAPPGAPTAINIFTGALVPADANFQFDVAFDIDSVGEVAFIPQSVIASGLAVTHSVGFQIVPDTFEAVSLAPKNGYRADTTLFTRRDNVVVVQDADPGACNIALTGSAIYGKIVVTAVDRVNRQVKIQYTVDPNCGFRSFDTGIPKE